MADDNEDTPMRTEEGSSDSDSGSGSESEEEQIEWLVTTREKRSTAGNRLALILQQEEPDDELELLFAEADDDAGFEDVDEDSDVQMDSSDDDEDQGPTAGADDLEGEKELRRAERQAKKRKVNDGIPKIFKKKVKIDPTASQGPAPRPKKKSERASWIPTAEDAPTRASARGTTRQSKEQLHAQMIDREVKRLKQLANMEKAAAAKAAAKKPAMTQADRLAEAARVEKSNSKSLSRWEEAEQQREEEQRAKLAALSNRQLEGPVITWWSGMGEWVGGVLKRVGKTLELEEPKEKPTKKRKAAEMETESAPTPLAADQTLKDPSAAATGDPQIVKDPPTAAPGDPQIVKDSPAAAPGDPQVVKDPPAAVPGDLANAPNESTTTSSPAVAPPAQTTNIPETNQPPNSASPQPPPEPTAVAPTPNPPSHPPFILAPPLGLQSPPLPPPVLDGSAPLPGFGYTPNSFPHFMPPQGVPLSFTPPNQQSPPPPPPPAAPPGPPPIEHAALDYIILSNFDENAIKHKDVQTQVLFGRKFPKATSTSLSCLCFFSLNSH